MERNTGPMPDCKVRGQATFSIDIFNTVSPLVKPLLVKIALIRVQILKVRRPTFWFMLFQCVFRLVSRTKMARNRSRVHKLLRYDRNLQKLKLGSNK